MAVIEYTAADRADLVTGHTVGTNYQILVKLISYSMSVDQPKTMHTALNGRVETVLKRATKIYSATVSWSDAINANMEEFLFSIAGGELFSFDPYGTIVTPDQPLEVVSINSQQYGISPIQRSSTPARRVMLTMRPAISRL